ncbi:MAG: hypothetical protein ACD_79C00429G0004 [uncultured bacterium]|nr:MAG: hypothetical protein ACD_79C00429G0004 [uncultured bacterium]
MKGLKILLVFFLSNIAWAEFVPILESSTLEAALSKNAIIINEYIKAPFGNSPNSHIKQFDRIKLGYSKYPIIETTSGNHFVKINYFFEDRNKKYIVPISKLHNLEAGNVYVPVASNENGKWTIDFVKININILENRKYYKLLKKYYL